MKKLLVVIPLVCMFAAVFLQKSWAHAASASVEFSTSKEAVEEGETFSIVCSVDSSEGFNDVQADIEYDASVMEFVKGGKKVKGGNGSIRISSTGNESTVKRRTYSLQFCALESGTSSVQLGQQVMVTDSTGAELSVSSNRLIMTVKSKGSAEAGEPVLGLAATAAPASTSAPPVERSTNNKLKNLSFHCISMTPEFEPNVLEYEVRVDFNTQWLYSKYAVANKMARVKEKGNEELLVGENEVKYVVTAESGDKRTYRIKVIKESESETKVRQQKENQKKDISFAVYEEDGKIYIQNQYQFQIMNPPDDTIPSGYVKTMVEVDGKNIPAYTMEKDLDNNYLIMYLKGIDDEGELYQYDRQEKTLQRYTGTMVQKVNQGGNVVDSEGETFSQSMWPYVVIVILTVLVLALLIVILNMILKRKFSKGKKELDDLDF